MDWCCDLIVSTQLRTYHGQSELLTRFRATFNEVVRSTSITLSRLLLVAKIGFRLFWRKEYY